MFIMGGILISRPGVRIGTWTEARDGQVDYLALAQYAGLPLLVALAIALALALAMKETYPKAGGSAPGPAEGQ